MNFINRDILETTKIYNYKLGNFFFSVEYDEEDGILISQIDPILNCKVFSSSVNKFFLQFKNKSEDFIIELDRTNPDAGIWVKKFIPDLKTPIDKNFLKMFPEEKHIILKNPPYIKTQSGYNLYSSYKYIINVGGFFAQIYIDKNNKLFVIPITEKISCDNIISEPYSLDINFISGDETNIFNIIPDRYGRGLFVRTFSTDWRNFECINEEVINFFN